MAKERTIGAHFTFTKIDVKILVCHCQIIGPAAAGSAEYVPTPVYFASGSLCVVCQSCEALCLIYTIAVLYK